MGGHLKGCGKIWWKGFLKGFLKGCLQGFSQGCPKGSWHNAIRGVSKKVRGVLWRALEGLSKDFLYGNPGLHPKVGVKREQLNDPPCMSALSHQWGLRAAGKSTTWRQWEPVVRSWLWVYGQPATDRIYFCHSEGVLKHLAPSPRIPERSFTDVPKLEGWTAAMRAPKDLQQPFPLRTAEEIKRQVYSTKNDHSSWQTICTLLDVWIN